MTKEQWRKRQRQWKRFNEWERQQTRRNRLSAREAFRVFDELYGLARTVGAWRGASSLGDIEPELRIASMVNQGSGG